jgi:hydrogenase maturation protease
MPIPPRTVVIGLGNPIMADDAVGLVALDRLAAGWDAGPHVTFEDGGTWGMNLLPLLENHEAVLFLDAINTGESAGTLVRLDGPTLPRQLALKVSPHQVDLQDVLAAATLRGTFPAQAVAVGVVPDTVEMRDGLSPSVASQVDAIVRAAVRELEQWGHAVERRVEPGPRIVAIAGGRREAPAP